MQLGRLEGPPAVLHARRLEPVAPTLTVLVPTRPALVLGSTQRDVDPAPDVLARLGLDLVRRRSGGGAVVVSRDDPLWVDVDLPRSDPRWEDDVSRSFAWLGRLWASALGDLGVPATVHRGPYEPGRWGRLVCFAGRGPGEVMVDGAKAVGIAQRRTRAGCRFQCAVPRVWDPATLVEALVDPADREVAADDLAGVAAGPAVTPEDLLAALVARLG